MIGPIGSAESRSIQQRRATTVILEEDQDQDAINMNIAISSPKTCLQVEEIGSFRLGSQGESFSYHVNDIDGIHSHAIIDEFDSDTDGSTAHHSRKTSRCISINSVSEEDISLPTASKSCELSVNQVKKNVPFDDGVAEVTVTRIVMEEQEVITAEVGEANEVESDKPKKVSEYDVQRKIEEKAKKLYAELSDEKDTEKNQRKLDRQSSLKGAILYDIEEKNENIDLSPEDAKAQRIKEIRANARRASLQKQEQDSEENQSQPIEEIETTKPRSKSIDMIAKPPIAKRLSVDNSEEPKDLYMENLLKQARRQRSVLDEIVDQKERSLSRSRETSRQHSVLSERRGSVSPEEEQRPQSFDSPEHRPNFTSDIENCTVEAGQVVLLQARVESDTKPKVTWFQDGQQIRPDGIHVRAEQTPDGFVNLHIDCAEPADSGEYQVLASNDSGVSASCAEVIVNEKRKPRDKRPIFIEYIDSCRAVEGYPIKLCAKVAAHPPPKIEWFHDSEKIESDQNHIKIVEKPDGTTTCLIDNVKLDDRGEYKVVATNGK